MRSYEAGEAGRSILIYLEKGEAILESIEKAIEKYGIRDGMIVSGIGSANKVCYHRIGNTEDMPTNEYITVEGPIEVTALQGLIIDGQAHLHITCCSRDQTFGGHLEHGTVVQYLAEIAIQEYPNAELTRRLGEFGISYIDRK
ncbi:MAG: DNA-binding protein [Eubacteriales bacterium]|nr:DNA-binding protein [Eubacteriales bacterium]